MILSSVPTPYIYTTYIWRRTKIYITPCRSKTELIISAKSDCDMAFSSIKEIESYNDLMGIEGYVAKNFFIAYFEKQSWKGRKPRIKCDPLNATLDIGYTILFNFIEVFARMFGFDIYIGIYHRLWFKRKSLICDLMEPFRCIIDSQVRKAFNTSQCKDSDFNIVKNEYILKIEKNKDYCKCFMTY
ncbi:MAG: CRISPR-associated endonuclease Cas1 [Muribaculaceae bacterium]